MAEIAAALGTPIAIKTITHPDQLNADQDALHIMPIDWPVPPIAGSPDSRNGQVVVDAITTAAKFCRSGAASGMVTNPIQKSSLYDAGFGYPGHTEFLASLGHVDAGGPMMMLACDDLKVVPLTIHIPISAVAGSLSQDIIIAAGHLLDASLKRYFAMTAPRIAVTGLNPHAGENGSIGTEDQTLSSPLSPICSKLALISPAPTQPTPCSMPKPAKPMMRFWACIMIRFLSLLKH